MPKLRSNCSNWRRTLERSNPRAEWERWKLWKCDTARVRPFLGVKGLRKGEKGEGVEKTTTTTTRVDTIARRWGWSHRSWKFERSITLSCYPNPEFRKLHGNSGTDILRNLRTLTNSWDLRRNILGFNKPTCAVYIMSFSKWRKLSWWCSYNTLCTNLVLCYINLYVYKCVISLPIDKYWRIFSAIGQDLALNVNRC